MFTKKDLVDLGFKESSVLKGLITCYLDVEIILIERNHLDGSKMCHFTCSIWRVAVSIMADLSNHNLRYILPGQIQIDEHVYKKLYFCV